MIDASPRPRGPTAVKSRRAPTRVVRRGGYQQANDLGNLFLKEEVQLCRHHAYQEGYDNTALKSHELDAQTEYM